MFGAIIVFFLMVLFAVAAGAVAFGYANKIFPQLTTNRNLKLGVTGGLIIAAVILFVVFVFLARK